MYTMYAVQLICTNFLFYSTGITKKQLTNVEMHDKIASFKEIIEKMFVEG